MKRYLWLLLLVLWAAPLRAADVDGKWAGNISTPNGDVTIGFDFKADGTTLTGSMIGPDGMPIAIKNGKTDGNKIAFLVSIDFGGMMFDLNYTGVVSATEIKMSADFAGMPFEFVVNKKN